MAVNKPHGDGHRIGAVRQRSQTYNPKTGQWVKRDSETGRFMDVKQDGTPFKGVRKEGQCMVWSFSAERLHALYAQHGHVLTGESP